MGDLQRINLTILVYPTLQFERKKMDAVPE